MAIFVIRRPILELSQANCEIKVETVEQAKHVISAAKFGSKRNGTRSAPPFRLFPGVTDQPWQAGRDIFEALNDQAAIMIQIESLAGKYPSTQTKF
jgi:2-keto-3-deoxy-L-rhamnonate aldolase RhmA